MWNTKCGSLPQLGCILVFSSHGLRIPSGRPQNTPKTSTMPSETYFSPCGATSFHFIIIEARSFDPCPFRKTVSRSFHGRFGDEFDAPVAWKSTPTHHGLLTWAKNSKNKENRRCLKMTSTFGDFHISDPKNPPTVEYSTRSTFAFWRGKKVCLMCRAIAKNPAGRNWDS